MWFRFCSYAVFDFEGVAVGVYPVEERWIDGDCANEAFSFETGGFPVGLLGGVGVVVACEWVGRFWAEGGGCELDV